MSSQKSIWTPANIVTTIRVVLMPLWLLLAELFTPETTSNPALLWITPIFFAFLSLTDKLDGYLARSRGEVTNFGKFLDPIADKLLVVVAIAYLLEHGMVSAWVLLIIVAREFLVSGLRMVIATTGIVIAASNLGKLKTASTMLSLCLYFLVYVLPIGPGILVLFAANILMFVAVILTAWSGIDYFVKAWPALISAEE